MTKKSKDYSGERLRMVVLVDDKSFKGMVIFPWMWMSDGFGGASAGRWEIKSPTGPWLPGK